LGTDSVFCIIKNDDPSFAKATDVSKIKTAMVKVYPNPVTDVLRIEGLNSSSKTELQIIDVNGNILLTTIINSSTAAIKTKAFSRGSYYLRITNNLTVEKLKFIKQ
jgi:hypothetical protein